MPVLNAAPAEQTIEEHPANPAPENPAPAPEKKTVPAPDPAPATPATAAAAPPAKPSVFQKAAAMLKDKSELIGQISALEGSKIALEATVSDLQAKLSASNERLTKLDIDIKEFEATVENLTKEKKTVSAAVVDQVAALGFSQEKLPAVVDGSADGEAPTSMEAFTAKHAELTKTDATAASKFYNQYAKKFGL
ncbi:MAG: hypothetical protein H0X34_19035 [Chthoniobacterales bacterium]|nr:hypothetical protein [Chthoniobacterales bacterium]